MTNKTIKKLTKAINVSNAAFAKMEPRDQRVTVARDVIAGLKAKKLVAESGHYIVIYNGSNFDEPAQLFRHEENTSFQKKLKELPKCNVCAKGAIFACTVARRNEVKNSDVKMNNMLNGQKMSELLGGLFKPEQLRLIETEFEGQDYEWVNKSWDNLTHVTGDRIFPVMNLPARFQDLEDRMICIMENIIRNRGTFRPDKEVWKA